ncbi:MAG: VOC family protein [Polaromonas sp.]|uniref:VOC family protein n=1 Tax=Rhodoferax sp. TaxID=50421 RepID=UPI0032667EB7
MATQMFINLPVKDLGKSVTFFTALGFKFNPQFTSEQATCMIVNDGASYVMLLVEPFFRTFTPKAIADTANTTEVLLSLSCDSRAQVDALVKKAVAAGGSTPNEAQDHGFMYDHGFQDLDGHQWGLFWMNPAQPVQHKPA